MPGFIQIMVMQKGFCMERYDWWQEIAVLSLEKQPLLSAAFSYRQR
jgi:hypothetical protein